MFRLFTQPARKRDQDRGESTAAGNTVRRDAAATYAFAALAHPVRREIVRLLRNQPMNATELGAHCDIARPTLTGHLNILKAAGLVSTERQRTSIQYRLNLRALEDITSAVSSTPEANGVSPPR